MSPLSEHDAAAWRHLYPFEGKTFDRGQGILMHYLDEGQGEPVVMVHGNPSWSFYFRELVRDLSRDHRCIVPDHVGCGLSDKPEDADYTYTLESRDNDLERLLDSLAVRERITLIVHDWGGMIGMAWAARHPESVSRIVLLNTGAFRLPEAKAFPALLRLARDFRLGHWLIDKHNAFARGAAWLGVTRKALPKAVREGLVAPYVGKQARRATLRFVQDIPLNPSDRAWALVTDTESRLGAFSNLPTLACWGMKDFVFDRHFLDMWCRIWPKLEVYRYEDAGHYILEDAREEVLAKVRSFLERHPLSPKGQNAGQPPRQS